MKVFLVPNYYKTEAVQSGLTLELWLNRQGYDVAWAADQRSSLNVPADIEGSDLCHLAWVATAPCCAPFASLGDRQSILGLSYGHLGFLTAASPEDVDILSVVTDALAGEMHVSRRAMLRARVYSILEEWFGGGFGALRP